MNIQELIEEMNITCGSVVSVVGCGGKTSFITEVARCLSKTWKVGIAASTKMAIPAKGTYTDIFIRNHRECTEPVNEPGIYYFADEIVPGKLHGFGSYMLLQAKGYMDVLLIEADGSKNLPLKGWSDHEPVIVEDTTMTVGILNLSQLGKRVNSKNVHRLKEFETLTGITSSELIDTKHIAAMVNHKQGMFKGSFGKKILLINQADHDYDLRCANYFCSDQPLKVDQIYYGSMHNDDFYKYERVRRKKVAAIVMASGFSQRMGENKLMMKVQGQTLIDRVLHQLDFVDVYKRIVVTAYDTVAECAKKHARVEIVMNEHPELGQSQSIVCGLQACPEDCDGFMFLTGDMPGLTENTMNLLLTAFENHDRLIVPVYGKHRGNPVVFPAAYKKDLLNLKGDRGGRSILDEHPSGITEVTIDDAMEGMDIDTREDLAAFEAITHKGH